VVNDSLTDFVKGATHFGEATLTAICLIEAVVPVDWNEYIVDVYD
jgi:hypothetical protein